jgi:hypothetical protein
MTLATRQWHEVPPRRGAFSALNPADLGMWEDRLRFDRRRAERHQSPAVAAITEAVDRRGRELGAAAIVLTGSTARGKRTRVSDLDYHVIGASPDIRDLPEEIDLYCDEPSELLAKLRAGDDFAHWSVWYGCILFDSGPLRSAARYVAECDAWPDAAGSCVRRRLRSTSPNGSSKAGITSLRWSRSGVPSHSLPAGICSRTMCSPSPVTN